MNIGPSVISRNSSDAGYFVVFKNRMYAGGLTLGRRVGRACGDCDVEAPGAALCAAFGGAAVGAAGAAVTTGGSGFTFQWRGSPYTSNVRSTMNIATQTAPRNKLTRRRASGLLVIHAP